MYRFYVEEHQVNEECATIYGSDVNHIKNVLRMKIGERIIVCDGQGKDYYGMIQQISSEEVVLEIEGVKESKAELPTNCILFQGLPKSDKMEWVIQKAVELGVYEIVPMTTARCVSKFRDEKKKKKKIDRWQAIAESAAKQSARGIIPVVKEPMTLIQAIDYAKQLDYNLIPYELAEGMEQSRMILEEATKHKSIGIFIGPEGGFEESEITKAKEAGFEVAF